MSASAMKAALETAGYKDARECLRQIAAACVAQHTTMDDARNEFLKRVLANPALAQELFRPWLKVASDDYLSAAARKAVERRREEAQPDGAVMAVAAPSLRANPIVSNIVPVRSHLRGKAGTVADQPDAVMARAAARAAREPEVKNYLRLFTVNGRPVGEVTGMEARAWITSHRRDARFVELLSDGVPDMATIGSCRTPDEAAALYERAKKGE